ncbi:hypothetical protein SynA18461_01107 [Synechococcus sp. A18-46.1]|nr:hypothetical protein SynA18461_01107 [Synechococcus sp. A18-46.1]
MHTIQPNCTKNEGQLRDKPFDLVLQLRAKWQQRPPGPALVGCVKVSLAIAAQ